LSQSFGGKMSREEAAAGPLRVSAIAGTRVVLMALDIEPAGVTGSGASHFRSPTDNKHAGSKVQSILKVLSLTR
jgi:hypothetical protein